MNGQVITSARSLLWKRVGSPSLERFTLSEKPTPMLSGTVVLELAGQPATVRYRAVMNAAWQTKQVTVSLSWGETERRLELRVDDEQRWWCEGQELTHLRGLYDVDLSVTPATNTLPLRRLRPSIGERSEVTAAWVKFPELEPLPLPQRYTRLSETRYRYESGDAFADFSAELEVDSVGLVTDYTVVDGAEDGPQGWTRLPSASGG